MATKFLWIALLSASILLVCKAESQAQTVCTSKGCTQASAGLFKADRPKMALQPGQPARNAARASAGALKGASKVVKKAVVVPVRAVGKTVKFFRDRKPIRKGLAKIGKGAAKVFTFRGPIAKRIRGRGC